MPKLIYEAPVATDLKEQNSSVLSQHILHCCFSLVSSSPAATLSYCFCSLSTKPLVTSEFKKIAGQGWGQERCRELIDHFIIPSDYCYSNVMRHLEPPRYTKPYKTSRLLQLSLWHSFNS